MKKILILLFIFPNSLYAIDVAKKFGVWEVARTEYGSVAMTLNSTGDVIAFTCFSSTNLCLHTLSPSINCENNANYPILINTDMGGLTIAGVCRLNSQAQQPVLDLTPYADTNNALKKGNNIGFAIPMASGKFKVVRFNLDGSEAAMSYAEQLALESKPDNEML